MRTSRRSRIFEKHFPNCKLILETPRLPKVDRSQHQRPEIEREFLSFSACFRVFHKWVDHLICSLLFGVCPTGEEPLRVRWRLASLLLAWVSFVGCIWDLPGPAPPTFPPYLPTCASWKVSFFLWGLCLAGAVDGAGVSQAAAVASGRLRGGWGRLASNPQTWQLWHWTV